MKNINPLIFSILILKLDAKNAVNFIKYQKIQDNFKAVKK